MNAPFTLLVSKTNRDTYIIEQIDRYNSYKLEIDGIVVDLNRNSIEIHSEPKKCYILTTSSYLAEYVLNTDNSIIKSVFDYENEKKELLKNSFIVDGEVEFESFDQGYAYGRFMHIWKPVTKISETKSDVVIQIRPIIYSEYAEIVPLHSLTGENLSDTTCKYKSNYVLWFSDICKSLDILDEKTYKELPHEEKNDTNYWSISTHSLLRFVKINEEYLFNDQYERESFLTDTYEKCVICRNKDYNTLDKIVKDFFKVRQNKKLSKIERQNLLKSLQIATNLISEIDVMKNSREYKTNALNKLHDIIALLKECK